MQVTEKQIANSVVKFLDDVLIVKTNDAQLKLVLSMIRNSVKNNYDLLEEFLENPIIASSVSKEGDEYEISHLINGIREVYEETSTYPITIPSIPILSPYQKEVKISEADFEKFVNYLSPSTVAETEDEE